MKGFPLKYKPFGTTAILIEWPDKMSEPILDDILHFYQKIIQQKRKDAIEIIQSINSLTVIYDNSAIHFDELKIHLEKLYKEKIQIPKRDQYLWKIPVCYDAIFGLDLREISKKSNIPILDIIQLHTQSIYLIYAIGFLPGFLYLGGLDERLYFDRKSAPRMKVPKGAVGIGGKQTGIYPKASPGGWQIIGNSPINFFDKTNTFPCLQNQVIRFSFMRFPFQSMSNWLK